MEWIPNRPLGPAAASPDATARAMSSNTESAAPPTVCHLGITAEPSRQLPRAQLVFGIRCGASAPQGIEIASAALQIDDSEPTEVRVFDQGRVRVSMAAEHVVGVETTGVPDFAEVPEAVAFGATAPMVIEALGTIRTHGDRVAQRDGDPR